MSELDTKTPSTMISSGTDEGSKSKESASTKKTSVGHGLDLRRRAIYEACRKQGYSIREAAELAGYNYSYARQMESKGETGVFSPRVSDSETIFDNSIVAAAKKALSTVIRDRTTPISCFQMLFLLNEGIFEA